VTGPAPADGLMLAMDTATRACLVALGRPDPVAISRRDVHHRHGAYLLEQVEEALERAGATLDDLTALVVGTGPGSFTGLRVGLATAKTLAYALGLPLVALPVFWILPLSAALPVYGVVLGLSAAIYW